MGLFQVPGSKYQVRPERVVWAFDPSELEAVEFRLESSCSFVRGKLFDPSSLRSAQLRRAGRSTFDA
ncbi:MAG TPA: hypothetical protein VGA18_01380 [Rhodothermales bacterium]